ncbi:hypothetical protein IAD21_04952 [Abditibacteriota bacterium]|nr:hypothetical protein IAD21_04952 [Abditibacteriota bacterium]
MISLLSFVQTGRLDDVELGTKRDEVERAFGPPNDWFAGHQVTESPIWKYGNIELHFDAEDRVFLIFCDNFYVPPEAPFAFDVSELGEQTEADVESWLQRKEIRFEKVPYLWVDGVTVFRVPSDVELKVYADDSVSTDESNIARLCSVSRIAR